MAKISNSHMLSAVARDISKVYLFPKKMVQKMLRVFTGVNRMNRFRN